MTYREMCTYCTMQVVKIQDKFKQDIILNDATTNKLIEAHPLNKKAKVISLTKVFNKIFAKK